MIINLGYLLSAIISTLRSKPKVVDQHVWRLLIAGIVGGVIYILAFGYLIWYLVF
ncbi:MAG: hypothetical protein OHK0017_10610 [Patescibacteria group bacterium]